jgi:hypothetical protein
MRFKADREVVVGFCVDTVYSGWYLPTLQRNRCFNLQFCPEEGGAPIGGLITAAAKRGIPAAAVQTILSRNSAQMSVAVGSFRDLKFCQRCYRTVKSSVTSRRVDW